MFLSEYRLIRKLGEGTFSEVIKAESTKTRQKVAIKCMKSVFNSVEQVRTLARFFNILTVRILP